MIAVLNHTTDDVNAAWLCASSSAVCIICCSSGLVHQRNEECSHLQLKLSHNSNSSAAATVSSNSEHVVRKAVVQYYPTQTAVSAPTVSGLLDTYPLFRGFSRPRPLRILQHLCGEIPTKAVLFAAAHPPQPSAACRLSPRGKLPVLLSCH